MPYKVYIHDQDYKPLDATATFVTDGNTELGKQQIQGGTGTELTAVFMENPDLALIMFQAPGYYDYSVPPELLETAIDNTILLEKKPTSIFLPVLLALAAGFTISKLKL